MQLRELLRDVPTLGTVGPLDRTVTAVTRDSRVAGPDAVYVAVRGASVDGHRFASQVDAAAVVVEEPVEVRPGVTRILVADTKLALARVAAALHGHPARSVDVVGITGTNGKTTIAAMVEEALVYSGRSAARVGTVGNRVDGKPHPVRFTTPTTPEAPDLQAFLAELRDRGVGSLVMEVTSIGLDQRRVDGIPFALAMFTNLSPDHLDFHGTMARYAAAKARLFTELLRPAGGLPRALLYGDDPAWRDMHPPEDRWLYGFDDHNDIHITEVALDARGIRLTLRTPVGSGVLTSPMVGRHNAANLAGAVGACLLRGLVLEAALEAVGSVRGVPGRLEVVGTRPLVLVDYAHSPDALDKALAAARELVPGEVWAVFGCGGDRDRTKRPLMGQVAESRADQVVVTSDNPRHEDPARIVDEILAGMGRGPGVRAEVDRAAAIRLAVAAAGPDDVVLIAGKGHETTQQIGDDKRPFDDREIARAALEDR